MPIGRGKYAVAAILPVGHTRLYLPAFAKNPGAPVLPLFGYTAVAWGRGKFWVAAVRSDDTEKMEIRPTITARILPGASHGFDVNSRTTLWWNICPAAQGNGIAARHRTYSIIVGRQEFPLRRLATQTVWDVFPCNRLSAAHRRRAAFNLPLLAKRSLQWLFIICNRHRKRLSASGRAVKGNRHWQLLP